MTEPISKLKHTLFVTQARKHMAAVLYTRLDTFPSLDLSRTVLFFILPLLKDLKIYTQEANSRTTQESESGGER